MNSYKIECINEYSSHSLSHSLLLTSLVKLYAEKNCETIMPGYERREVRKGFVNSVWSKVNSSATKVKGNRGTSMTKKNF